MTKFIFMTQCSHLQGVFIAEKKLAKLGLSDGVPCMQKDDALGIKIFGVHCLDLPLQFPSSVDFVSMSSDFCDCKWSQDTLKRTKLMPPPSGGFPSKY